MTFRPKSLDDVPSRTPDVNIFFSGQLLLRSEDGATCEVGVNHLAANHVLTIEARTKVAGEAGVITSDLIRMRHVGPLNFREHEGVLIEVDHPAAASPAAWGCRTFATTPVHPNDFRWILNLEGPDFHARELHPTVFPNTPRVIRLQGGQYFFRTAMRSNGRFEYSLTRAGEEVLRFPIIGAVACASVFLDPGQEVKLTWKGLNKDADNFVRLSQDTGTTHEIYINNTPLFVDPPPGIISDEELKQFDELVEYYKIIPVTEVPQDARFQLVPVNPVRSLPGHGQTGTPDIPCQVMLLDGAGT